MIFARICLAVLACSIVVPNYTFQQRTHILIVLLFWVNQHLEVVAKFSPFYMQHLRFWLHFTTTLSQLLYAWSLWLFSIDTWIAVDRNLQLLKTWKRISVFSAVPSAVSSKLNFPVFPISLSIFHPFLHAQFFIPFKGPSITTLFFPKGRGGE